MPELDSCRFNGTITDPTGKVLGETRLWGAGTRGPDGGWSGWLYPADLGALLPPGRYTVTAFVGWEGVFEIAGRPPSRVFETDLVPVTGVGPAPWPEPGGIPSQPDDQPPVLNTPWQGGQDIPPFKAPGPNDPPPGAVTPNGPATP